MTQEEKELLFRDLSARIIYGLKCYPVITNGKPNTIDSYRKVLDDFYVEVVGRWVPISTIKPYLRPMSSMTEEENKEIEAIYQKWFLDGGGFGMYVEVIDWLNAHHFDYRGLIDRNHALEAPEGMYK